MNDSMPGDWILLSLQCLLVLWLAFFYFLFKASDKDGDGDGEGGKKKEEMKAKVTYADLYPIVGEGSVEETENNIALRQVEDDIPDSGLTVLRRLDVGEFEYWADKSVPFGNLEALARKWVLVYNDLDSYVERKRVLELRSEPNLDSVFAPLKTYKAATTVVKEEHCNKYRWRGRVREVPLQAEQTAKDEGPKNLRYSDFKKNV